MFKKLKIKILKSFINEYFDDITDYIFEIAKIKGEHFYKSLTEKLKNKIQAD